MIQEQGRLWRSPPLLWVRSRGCQSW
ncbi:hypothetical protein EYF80_059219 [Liparis tanakae]|uniref:Uncharacterized protein n=1 Tax=Liparis tanakae TaxID=230148 RepID=A0A4Z2EPU6_9TELE|nr:hypothetical protein EYF80_059219 [Liparis tanakae]